jgi:hypothetical protein
MPCIARRLENVGEKREAMLEKRKDVEEPCVGWNRHSIDQIEE